MYNNYIPFYSARQYRRIDGRAKAGPATVASVPKAVISIAAKIRIIVLFIVEGVGEMSILYFNKLPDTIDFFEFLFCANQ